MPTAPRSTRDGSPPGVTRSAREKWEQAASHRSHGEAGRRVLDRQGAVPERDDAGDKRLEDSRLKGFLHQRDGVFYPSGHAVLLLARDEARALHGALEAAGFALTRMMLIEPEDAVGVMRDSETEAGTMARLVGAEIRNVAVMRQLAEAGNAMLIVRVGNDEEERSVVATARQWRVRKALRYHALAVQELRVGTEEVPGESPYGVNEVLRSKPTEARLKPRLRNDSAEEADE